MLSESALDEDRIMSGAFPEFFAISSGIVSMWKKMEHEKSIVIEMSRVLGNS